MSQVPYSLSRKQLIIAFFSALCVAVVTLVLFILPAEYNVDPTGIGKSLGLTALAGERPANPVPAKPVKESAFELVEFTVPAGKGVEYKLAMQQYAKLTYEWVSYGGGLYFDLHGEPEGDSSGYFESYAEATGYEMKGSFTTPFTGSHGWYFKNNAASDATVKLMIKGDYTIIGLKQ